MKLKSILFILAHVILENSIIWFIVSKEIHLCFSCCLFFLVWGQLKVFFQTKHVWFCCLWVWLCECHLLIRYIIWFNPWVFSYIPCVRGASASVFSFHFADSLPLSLKVSFYGGSCCCRRCIGTYPHWMFWWWATNSIFFSINSYFKFWVASFLIVFGRSLLLILIFSKYYSLFQLRFPNLECRYSSHGWWIWCTPCASCICPPLASGRTCPGGLSGMRLLGPTWLKLLIWL